MTKGLIQEVKIKATISLLLFGKTYSVFELRGRLTIFDSGFDTHI
jgi:hypothetical protein